MDAHELQEELDLLAAEPEYEHQQMLAESIPDAPASMIEAMEEPGMYDDEDDNQVEERVAVGM